METVKSIPEDLSEVIRLKERELHDINQFRYERLELNLIEKEKIISEFLKKFEELKEDFQYNLTLLEARDKEINRLESLISKLNDELDLKELELKSTLKKLESIELQNKELYQIHSRDKKETQVKRIVEVLNKTDLVKLSIKNKIINNEALPTNKDVFNKLFIDDSGGRDDKNMKVINEDLFKRRILGTISYYKTTGSELFPKMLPTISRDLFMSDHQIKKY